VTRSRPLADLGIRVLSALVFVPAFVILAWRGSVWFTALVCLLTAAGTREFLGLLRHAEFRPPAPVVTAAAVLLPWWVYWGDASLLWAYGVAVPVVVLGATVLRGQPRHSLRDAAASLLTVAYVAGLFGHLVLLRELPESRGGSSQQGFALVVLVFILVWVTDTGAYLVGSLWGRHRLAPGISPGKSVEGAVGAAVLTAMAGAVCAVTFLDDLLSPLSGAILGLVASLAGLVGDLVESMFKRDAGIKDASNIIPGHGGVLDRFDSVLFVGPLIYWATRWFLL
jgi:phosphatidate cytidylyltransferase